MKHENAKRKHIRRLMYFILMVVGLVSPYINSLWKMLELFDIKAAMRELRVKETDAKKVAEDTLDEITFRAILASVLSPCKNPQTISSSFVNLDKREPKK